MVRVFVLFVLVLLVLVLTEVSGWDCWWVVGLVGECVCTSILLHVAVRVVCVVR